MGSDSDGLLDIPEGMTREIIEGEPVASSEPSWKHHLAAAIKDGVLVPYCSEKENPGGWIFLLEPKLELGESLLVPDLAGWKKERLPEDPGMSPVSIVPDWVCEILSVETALLDKTRKMPVYAKHGMPYLWLVDPERKALGLLQAYRLDHQSGHWIWLGGLGGDEGEGVEPFDKARLQLGAILHKLAFIRARAHAIPKGEIVRRLLNLLEAGLSRSSPDDKPEDGPKTRD